MNHKKYITLDFGVGSVGAAYVPVLIGEALHPDDEIMQMVAAGNHLREFRAALKRGEIVARRHLDHIPTVPETAAEMERAFCEVKDLAKYVAKFGIDVRHRPDPHLGLPDRNALIDEEDSEDLYRYFVSMVEEAIAILRMDRAMPRKLAWAWMTLVSKAGVLHEDEARERDIDAARNWILKLGLPTSTEEGIPTDTTEPCVDPEHAWDVDARMFVRVAAVAEAARLEGLAWPDLDNLIVDGHPWGRVETGNPIDPRVPDPEASKQDAVVTESAAPTLAIGANPRSEVERYVAHLARTLFQHGDSTQALAEKIRLDMKGKGYRSERGAPSTGTIVRMLPVGLTGGRAKNGRK
ncbi:hypothetical protein [Cupriavidus sp. IK-TO18]|uniref:hypothetical protein n=1 Tax=Cupriavidus sp. IK-TO18 TaxID=2782182 RepID=UPI001897838F|nr:hypothetical protein [Cupriavidus sp. IK-TO18]MBF6990931.1 hypothetical protein [Cupriavidus sp. IK-TO18]